MKHSSSHYLLPQRVVELFHSSYQTNHPSATCDPEAITVLSWNIYKTRKQNAIADLRQFSHQHDLLILQEAHLGDELEEIFAENNLHWTMNTAFMYRKKATGVLIASRVKAVDSYGLRYREPLIRLPKTTLINYYPVANCRQTLLVANIHSINFTLGTTVYNRQLHELITVISQHDGPVIVAGDFNSWSRARLFLLQTMQKKLHLHTLDENTNMDKQSSHYGRQYKTRVFGNELDHIFYRGLEPVHKKIWPVDSSDHNPIQVCFRLIRTDTQGS